MAVKKNAGKFAALAKEATTLSEIMKGRTKVDVDELYGQEITITGFDFLSSTDMKARFSMAVQSLQRFVRTGCRTTTAPRKHPKH